MLTKVIFNTLALVTSLAVAAPAAAPVAELEKRAKGGVYICTDINWGGTCGYKVQPLDTCIHLDHPWWHTISSFGPDQGTHCTWYSDYNCQTEIWAFIGSPGYGDLRQVNANDKIGSFKCFA